MGTRIRDDSRLLRRCASSAQLEAGLAKLDYERAVRDVSRPRPGYVGEGEHRLRRYFSSPDLTAIHKIHYAGADDTISKNYWYPTKYLPRSYWLDGVTDNHETGYYYLSPLYWSTYKYPGRRYRITDFWPHSTDAYASRYRTPANWMEHYDVTPYHRSYDFSRYNRRTENLLFHSSAAYYNPAYYTSYDWPRWTYGSHIIGNDAYRGYMYRPRSAYRSYYYAGY